MVKKDDEDSKNEVCEDHLNTDTTESDAIQQQVQASKFPDAMISPDIFETSFKKEKRTPRKVLFWRPPVHPNGDPPDLPGGPTIVVDPPHYALQLQLSDEALCPDESGRAMLEAEIKRVLSEDFPSAEVRSDCDSTGLLNIGLWPTAASRMEVDEARTRALGALGLLRQGETFGMFMNRRFIRQIAQSEFARVPKRLNENGRPDSNGPIHLESLSSELVPPNQIVTRVEGYDDRPWPDIDFTATFTDTIGVASSPIVVTCGPGTSNLRMLTCSSSSSIDVDDGDSALAILLGLLSLPIPPLAGYLFNQLIEAAGSGAGGGIDGAVGCGLTAFANTPIPLPGRSSITNTGLLIAVTYSQRSVTRGGVFFRGSWTLCTRTPELFIDGPRLLQAYVEDTEVSAIYRIQSLGTFGTVTSSWSAPGAIVSAPSSQVTRITFPLQTGELSRTITLSGSDSDGSLPSVTATVQLQITDEPPSPGRGRGPGRPPEPF